MRFKYKEIIDTNQAQAAIRTALVMAIGKGAITRKGFDHAMSAVEWIKNAPQPSPAPAAWMPIADAPKELDPDFWLYDPSVGKAVIGYWERTRWCWAEKDVRIYPTHYMPIDVPAPPQADKLVDMLNDAPAWQPIATAPKDGTILGFTDMGWMVACRWVDDDEWSGGGVWIAAHGRVALTHWQPLPAPPQADEVCEYCGEPESSHTRCEWCGYSECDKELHGDHDLCTGKAAEADHV